MIKIFSVFFFCLILSVSVFTQTKTNLDIFYTLVDSSVKNMSDEMPPDQNKINLSLTLGNAYSIFNNQIISTLIKENKSIVDSSMRNVVKVNYVIDAAELKYGEMFRDGFLGEEMIPRTFKLRGNYLIKNNEATVKKFEFEYADTIHVDEINDVENLSYPFTRSDVPAEPFFSNIWEPVIAIGSAAIAVYLFFSVRSK